MLANILKRIPWGKKRIQAVTEALVPPEPYLEENAKTVFKSLSRGICPDCGSKKFYEGPTGGAAQNFKCAGCGSKFNIGLPFFAERA